MNRAIQASQLPSSARLVMLVLSDMADADTAEIPEWATPSQEELARRTGLTKKTLKYHLALLEEQGWLVRAVPTHEQLARHARIRYRLTVPAGAPEEIASVRINGRRSVETGVAITPRGGETGVLTTPRKGKTGVTTTPREGKTGVVVTPRGGETGVVSTPEGGSEYPPTGVTTTPRSPEDGGSDYPAKSLTTKDKNLQPTTTTKTNSSASGGGARGARPAAAPPESDGVPAKRTRRGKQPVAAVEGFDRFWSAYPRGLGIGKARESWAKHVIAAGVDPELVISAAEFFGLIRKGQDPKFTPLASTWLNQQRWEDTPDPEYRELNKAEQRNRDNLASVVKTCERDGVDPMVLLFPDQYPDHPEVIRMRAETEEWMRAPLTRGLPPSTPQEARRGPSGALAGRDGAPGRGRLF